MTLNWDRSIKPGRCRRGAHRTDRWIGPRRHFLSSPSWQQPDDCQWRIHCEDLDLIRMSQWLTASEVAGNQSVYQQVTKWQTAEWTLWVKWFSCASLLQPLQGQTDQTVRKWHPHSTSITAISVSWGKMSVICQTTSSVHKWFYSLNSPQNKDSSVLVWRGDPYQMTPTQSQEEERASAQWHQAFITVSLENSQWSPDLQVKRLSSCTVY